MLNTNTTAASINLSADAQQYTLTAKDLRDTTIALNGKILELDANDELPVITGEKITAGKIDLPPASISFFTFPGVGNKK